MDLREEALVNTGRRRPPAAHRISRHLAAKHTGDGVLKIKLVLGERKVHTSALTFAAYRARARQ